MKLNRKFGMVVAGAFGLATVMTIVMRPSIAASIEKGVYVALAEVFLSTFNFVLLSVLTMTYVRMYRELKTPISRSLIIFSSALALYAVSSSPVTHSLIGIEAVNIGPLTYVPEIFVAVASLTLLYENYQ